MPTNPAVFNRPRSRALYQSDVMEVTSTDTGLTYEFPTSTPSRVETTLDVVGLPFDRATHRFPSKPVRHDLVTYVPYQAKTVTGTQWVPYSYRTSPRPTVTPSDVERLVSWNPPLEIVSERDFAQQAFDKFGDQFPASLDFGNFLFEWNSVTELIPQMEKSISKTVSGAHLSYSFGMAPFVGDLEALMGIVKTVLDRIAWLRAHNGKTSRLRTSRTTNVTPAFAPEFSLSNVVRDLNWPDTAFRTRLIDRRIKMVATCRLRMDIDIPEGLEAIARGLVAALGLNNPMGTIYNSMPFSFVLDWVTRFGDVLDRHKYRTYNGTYEVSDFTTSVMDSRAWVVEYVYSKIDEANVDKGYAAWTSRQPGSSAPCGYLHDTRYRRDVGWTQTDFPSLIFPPSAGQAVLAASLLRGLT